MKKENFKRIGSVLGYVLFSQTALNRIKVQCMSYLIRQFILLQTSCEQVGIIEILNIKFIVKRYSKDLQYFNYLVLTR